MEVGEHAAVIERSFGSAECGAVGAEIGGGDADGGVGGVVVVELVVSLHGDEGVEGTVIPSEFSGRYVFKDCESFDRARCFGERVGSLNISRVAAAIAAANNTCKK